MICLSVGPDGVLSVSGQQTQDFSACQLVALTSQEISLSPFYLSSDDGIAIAYAVAMLWGLAFGFRALFDVLRGGSEDVQS